MAVLETFDIDAASEAAYQEKRCYSVEEIMDILAIGRRGVYDLIKENKFRAVLVSRRYRISKKSFDHWLDELQENDGSEDAEQAEQ